MRKRLLSEWCTEIAGLVTALAMSFKIIISR